MPLEKGDGNKSSEKSLVAATFLSALIALTPVKSEASRDMRLEQGIQEEAIPGQHSLQEMRDFYQRQAREFWMHLRSFPTNMQLGERLRKLPIQEQQALQHSLETFAANAIQNRESAVEAVRDSVRVREFVLPYARMRGVSESELQSITEVIDFIGRSARAWLERNKKVVPDTLKEDN